LRADFAPGEPGAAIGIARCLVTQMPLTGLLFGIEPTDPATLSVATAVLLIVALAASWFPTRKALRVEPVAARHEE